MKYVRVIMMIFVLSFIFAISGVKADYSISFNGIALSAFKGIYRSDQYQKTRANNNTYFHTTRTDKPSEARTYGYLNNTGYSEWTDSIVGSYSYWTDNKSIDLGLYRFEIRTQEKHLTSKLYWGHWVYDPA